MHTELLTITATAPGAAGAAATAAVGDSLTIKNGKGRVQIVALWADFQVAGFLQLVTPSQHDTTRGYRTRVPASDLDMRLPLGIEMDMQPQETIAATIAGSAVAGDVELACALVCYADLPGVTQRVIGWDELQRRAGKVLTVDATIVPGAAGYSGAELLTAETDLLHANTDYAIVGYSVSAECAAVTFTGPDLGYVRMGGPGADDDAGMTSGWFGLMSRATGKAMVPVINSGNKASTFVGIVGDENVAPIGVSVFLAQIGKPRD